MATYVMWNASLGKYDARPVTSKSRRNRLFIFFFNYFKHTALRSVAGAGFDAISGKDPYAHRSTNRREQTTTADMEF